MKSQNAFSKPITTLASQFTEVFKEKTTGTARVLYAEFSGSPKPQTLPGAIDIDDLVTELEQSPEATEAIAKGRQWVAKNFYKDQSPSIAQLRLQKGWSQAELARLTDTSQPHIARLELGRVDPQVSTLKKLAKALNVSIATVVQAISPEDVQ
ncbi:helix-turn-helix domain-containing protein [Rugosibacter aromaticivorans]|uniref:helix-turn-helix domain-containing protein n=1 Tax=Rugosibacter aromaticivorans TaxID=1565605 RepID=UPI00192A38FC|nr:helix-turn-helix transcriptional regulator [Rugosibacter aromaticivorans]